MRFYIAARFTGKEEVRRLYALLREQGHEITVDWTTHDPIKPYDQHPEKARDYALEDLQGVMDCEVFVLLTSEQTGSGSAGELGAAIASQTLVGKPKIYVVGEQMGNNCFYFHPTVKRMETIEDVLVDISTEVL